MIRVDHTGVPARARLDAASSLTRLFGLDPGIADDGKFAPVRVGAELTVDFFDAEQIEPVHVSFVADDATSDRIIGQLQAQEIAYGSQPDDPANRRVGHALAERGLYFGMPDGHPFEVMTWRPGAEET